MNDVVQLDDFKDVQKWNEQGFIPGPYETETAFKERVAFCLHLEEALKEQAETIPFDPEDRMNVEPILREACRKTADIYGINPQWVLLFFSNYQLAPWHGGCAWIFQLNKDTPTAAFLQLRKHFHDHSTFLGMYDRQELLTHELSHVGRMMFDEPRFEEVLAYASATSRWRRWWGPIVRSSKETLGFILMLIFILLINFTNLKNMHLSLFLLNCIPIIIVGIASLRLYQTHTLFNRCLTHLTEVCKDHTVAFHLIYRLTDREIETCARLTPSAIVKWIEEQSIDQWRWKLLKACFIRDV